MSSGHTSVKAVIFDLGNVMVSFDHLIAAQKICRLTSKSPQEIYALFFDSGLTRSFEEGRLSARDFFLRVKEMLDLSLTYEEFLPIWNEIFFLTEDNKILHSLIPRLKQNYKVLLLSNINILHYEYIKKHFSVLSVFDYIVASYEEGVVKPDPKIYRKALELLHLAPEEVFYTDDRKDLIEEALRLGIRAFLYQGAEQLKLDLKAAGLAFFE